MEVQFQFTLYLPFLLPRDSKEWGSDPITYSDSDLQIAIVTLSQDKAHDAPRGPDEMTVARIPPGQSPDITAWQITTIPHRYFYDVIVVAVRGLVSKPEDIFKPIMRARFLNAAIEATRRFLGFSRALARDTLIYFTGQEVTPEHLNFIGFPHCENWLDPQSGTILGDDSINFCSGEVVGGRSGINCVPWKDLQSGVQSSRQPPADILALLDAETAAVNFEDSKAVLLAAIAVEVAVKSFLQRTDADKDILKTLEDSLELRFWEKYFHLLLTLAQQPSLKRVMPDLYKQIEILFRVRNKIVHEGICYLERDGQGMPIVLKHREIAGLVDTARNIISWLDTLVLPVARTPP